jgi:hypothetical protein
MAPWLEVTVDHGMRRQKSLRLIGRFETLHLPLASSCGTMRVLSTIVEIPARPVPNVRQYRSVSDAIAAQSVGDEAARVILQTMEQTFEETFGGFAVPPSLHQDVQHDPALVHCAPQIVQHAPDPDEYLIEMHVSPGCDRRQGGASRTLTPRQRRPWQRPA